MISQVIKLRTDCSINKLKQYITRFFKIQINESRYILIQLKFQTVNNNIIKIGDVTTIDIKKVKDIASYKTTIEDDAIKCLNNKDDKVIKIHINYTELSRKEYLNFKKSRVY